MPRKRYSPEEIIAMLREADVRLSRGETIGQICRMLAVSEQSYYRWRREYGGLKVDQATRLKDLEKENQRFRRAVADLTLDAMILKEAAKGNF
jgi:putative transposase